MQPFASVGKGSWFSYAGSLLDQCLSQRERDLNTSPFNDKIFNTHRFLEGNKIKKFPDDLFSQSVKLQWL